ncbi:hypothetical protein [Natranaeroarchaeum aerophilus]|uniref:Uncharacterized protein n=1 Tax=Natranaeroarchaeum aerophilus TaxID=2917711 RepID=A0AAE3FSQ8_9EURY|nr:hypothetical protein [Natranaeroarchaeum aerophilus]MCL9813874.1 hypothetical protein [Natranaeroarchaeum aerophilus]
MSGPHELTPEQIIEDEQGPDVLTASDLLADHVEAGTQEPEAAPKCPRDDWLWLDKEKLDRKEIVAAQSRS